VKCTDCGKDVADNEACAGMQVHVSCRLKQIEAMPAVAEVVKKLGGRIACARGPLNAWEVQRSMHTGSLRETGR